MAQVNAREVVLLGASTQSTTGVSNDINLPQGYTAAIITLAVTSVTGTSPTLNVYLQNKLPQAASTDVTGVLPTGTAIYDDCLAFNQVSTTGTQVARWVGGGNAVATNSVNALTAGTVVNGPIGGTWKISYVLGGTSPVFNFNVTAELIP